MATNTQRITALEARIKAFEDWKAAHLVNDAGYRAVVDDRLTRLEAADIRLEDRIDDHVDPPPPPPPPPPAPLPIPYRAFRASYFGDKTLGGEPIRIAEVPSVGADWAALGPIGVPADSFSARYEGRFPFAAGDHDFTATADDGVRVWLDGVSIIDEWRDQSVTTFTKRVAVTAGEHLVKVEYYENTGLATLVATWKPSAVVIPPPDPDPVPPPPTGFPAFLSRPALPARGGDVTNWAVYDSPTDLALTNFKIASLGLGKRAIVIRNPKGSLTLTDLDFLDVGICILVQAQAGSAPIRVTVERCRVRGILGPSRTPSGGRSTNMANFVQFDNVRMAGRMGDNLIQVKSTSGGDTEDIFSITGASGGIDNAGWLSIDDNKMDGEGSTSISGSGIALSDGSGGFTQARRNRLLNPGQVGMFVASGGPAKMLDNVIYGRGNPNSNQPWYVSKYGTVAPHDVEVARNKVDWINKAGQRVGGYVGETGANINVHDNDWQTAIDPATLRVTL